MKTVNSDFVVIALHALSVLPNLEELWVENGSGKLLQYLHKHSVTREVSNLLPFFQVFTGVHCDQGKREWHCEM